MHDIAPVIAVFVFSGAIAIPVIIRMVFRHQVEMAKLSTQADANPQLVQDMVELKKQVADLRELMMDIALKPTQAQSLQERVQSEAPQPRSN